ncbi:MAG: redoxin family protein [Armatimonas sp.]
MKTKRRFWIGAGAALLLGVPGALLARVYLKPSGNDTHSHAGDPALRAAIINASGAERIKLLRGAMNDDSPARRLVVADNLGTDPQDSAIGRALLNDNDSEVRRKAAYALAELGAPADYPYIRAALVDDDLWMREELSRWASTRVGKESHKVGDWLIPELITCLDTPSEPIRSFASGTLSRLTHKPWRYTTRLSKAEKAACLQRWRDWWKTAAPRYGTPVPLPDIEPHRIDPAPTVTIQTTDDKECSPATDGKVTLVNFWGTWCPPCQIEVPELQTIHELYGAKGVQVIGVALSEPQGEAGLTRWCQAKGLTYPQALGTDAIVSAYGDIQEIPVTLLIDKRGRLRYRWQGERTAASFIPMIERLLKE